MFNWEANIEKVSNGYVIGKHQEDDEGNPFIEKTIIEEKEVYDENERVEELKTFQEMIWHLAEYFGITLSSKHEKINLEMKITETKEEEN